MAEKKVLAAFGEIMLRLAAPRRLRLTQALPGQLDATFGGGEANVCVSLSMLGASARYLTVVPENPVSDAMLAELRKLKVEVDHVMRRADGRMGIYFVEHGAAQRGSGVWYDREHSAIATAAPEEYDFAAMLEGVSHLHLTGITPALSRNAYLSVLGMAQCAKKLGCTVSCDLNYRKKLWNWEPGTPKNELANRCMSEIVRYADWIIGNEADAGDVFGIVPANSDVESGKLDVAAYRDVAGRLSAKFPDAKLIAFTLRGSVSADFNYWGGMVYDCRTREVHFAPCGGSGDYEPYAIRDIVDRFGGGDSFCAGLLYALHSERYADPASAVRFAAAASCLKHTIEGDYNLVSEKEVVALMNGGGSGRVAR